MMGLTASIQENSTIFNTSVSSKVLQNRECKLAHYENPIAIDFVVSDRESHYDPQKKRIQIVINKEMLRLIMEKADELSGEKGQSFDPDIFVQYTVQDKKAWQQELDLIFSDDIKNIIYHELVHWIDDTKQNRFLVTMQDMKKSLDYESYIEYLQKKYKVTFEPLVYYEVNAQIHMMYQRSRTRKDWDSLTIYEAIEITNGLSQLFDLIQRTVSEQDLYGWLKSLIKRMHREGFLGKNMNYIPKTTAIMQEQRICSHGYSTLKRLA